jgi:hypothetical protein
MWLFLPSGLLMPAAVPADKADPVLTRDGTLLLQVRARVESHLTNFINDYMEEGKYSDIEATPQMDYNFRFYTTHADFALAMAKAIVDIDYKKFKPTAEDRDIDGRLLYKDGKEYHGILNSIWGTLCKLNTPGGSWGRYSATNPNGYKSAKDSPYKSGKQTGSSFYGQSGMDAGSIVHQHYMDDDYWDDLPPLNSQTWEDFDADGFPIERGFPANTQDIIDGVWEEGDPDMPDYNPSLEQRKQDIYDGLGDLPVDQWMDFLTEEDWSVIKGDVAAFEQKAMALERDQNIDARLDTEEKRWTNNASKMLDRFLPPRKKARKGKRYTQVN